MRTSSAPTRTMHRTTILRSHAPARLAGARRGRSAGALVGILAGALLALAACDTPAHKEDTNFSKYNYSYNK
ncbi:MAG: hypothetical protein U0575_11005 [Phycisphaerales bacterium]